MQNKNGAAQSKALVFVIVLVVVIAGILLIGQDKSAVNRVKETHSSALNSLKVAISKTNKIVNDKAIQMGASQGANSIVIDSVSLGTFNGYLSTKAEDLKNALGFVFNGKQSINPSTVNWQFQQVGDSEDGIPQVRIFDPMIKKENCYLLYRQAGNKQQATDPSSTIVDSGC
ncbi:hypothetical protein JQC92_13035 [Shewanella sp. 202IG2-18]|uniref:hypothetical protein n=1 Tax=Parashewanella hymeniacidonis TaxID=2807618 RepID=UPI00195FE6F1|nr:hypothetical protein [Parashewanella hymeniacidonis]MBM7072939.1 hypothetical protein [Parashewanella hymeniacidonis]